MIRFLKTYKAFIFSYVLIVPIFYVLEAVGFLIFTEEQLSSLYIYALVWGTIIALPFHFYKQNKRVIVGLSCLVLLFFMIMFVDSKMNLPDNPITIVLLIGFWFGLAYVLAPHFIKKYRLLFALIYGPLVLYFLYLRLLAGSLEAYLVSKETLPLYFFFMPIPIFILLWVFEQWKWLQKLKAEKSQAELAMLRSQINPHFFFNTLNNLYALSVKKSDEAPGVILKLSDMMRYTIYEGAKDQIKISDEIDYLNNYIQLHKIRYRKSVDIHFTHDIDSALTVAPLLFIILLENAFKHGVETLSEAAYIHLHLFEDKDSINFEIENNFDANETTSAKGIGLENLKRRLSLLYKNKHELVVNKTNTVYSVKLKISKYA